ncbi:pilus assembly protein [Xylanimonas oleitrophica]|uniref:Pilus assembly protein n=1 Tax=Xylanimonas oleitrophica TaxID=2607479 RepID=A0A2W5WVE1_9MICO|nr:TadE/TadG family type IV pilus assembly protein [Xylanimonas oleitrophica]PZR55130.1 pilus assembly protein [Xylanimonas oleitrophica]
MAEFAMVAALVVAIFLAVAQVGFVQHVRALAIDAAAEGARVAARADRTAADGAARTRELLSTSLSARYASDVTVGRTHVDGLPVVEVTVRTPFPVVGVLGPSGAMTVQGHALEEG